MRRLRVLATGKAPRRMTPAERPRGPVTNLVGQQDLELIRGGDGSALIPRDDANCASNSRLSAASSVRMLDGVSELGEAVRASGDIHCLHGSTLVAYIMARSRPVARAKRQGRWSRVEG